jgi:hypothetical protein
MAFNYLSAIPRHLVRGGPDWLPYPVQVQPSEGTPISAKVSEVLCRVTLLLVLFTIELIGC